MGFIVIYGEYANPDKVQIFGEMEKDRNGVLVKRNYVFDTKEEAEEVFKKESAYPFFVLNW